MIDTFALRQARKPQERTLPLPLSSSLSESSTPSLGDYRQYVNDPKNDGTFVATAQSTVITAPDTFFGHTLAFFVGKSNAQEVDTLKRSLEKDLGPHVAQYAFPLVEQKQAALSNWEGYIQQVTNHTLTTALNPTLRGITLDLSIPSSEKEITANTPFYQRQLRPIIESTVKELNPVLQNINLDLSLSAGTPGVGLSHRLVKQVLERADTFLSTAAPYIKEAAEAVSLLTDLLDHLESELDPHQSDLATLKAKVLGLAQDVTAYHSLPSTVRSHHHQDLQRLLSNIITTIPVTLQETHHLTLKTKALITFIEKLKSSHDYFELGSTAPIEIASYNFMPFLEPTITLLKEEAALADQVIRILSSLPISKEQQTQLEIHLAKNAQIAVETKTYSQKIGKLQDQLIKELDKLKTKAQKRLTDATNAIDNPTWMRSLYENFLLENRSWEEEKKQAEEDLHFANSTKELVTQVR